MPSAAAAGESTASHRLNSGWSSSGKQERRLDVVLEAGRELVDAVDWKPAGRFRKPSDDAPSTRGS